MDYRPYQHLRAWQRARQLAIDVLKGSDGPQFRRDWGLRDQMRRSAISVPSNIAEGSERGSDPDCIRFLHIAKGSLAELATQVDLANAIGLLDEGTKGRWCAEADEIGRMLCSLIRHREGRSKRPR